MTERGIPEDWSADTFRVGDGSQFPRSPLPETLGPQTPDARRISKRVPRQSVNPDAPQQAEIESPRQSGEAHLGQPVPPDDGNQPLTPKPKRRGWSRSWVFWALLGGLISTGAGLVAVALLLLLPSAPNCPYVFWPLASATVRLNCAQAAANKQTVDDLLAAIALVQVLPRNHPLHEEISGYLEEWSVDILDLGEETFQAGKLQDAIAIARKIPQNIPTYQSVEQRIQSWQSTWSQAEGIYQDAEAELRKQHWHQAFMVAVKLLNVSNNYWTTNKYEELKNAIETTREDANNLAQAQSVAKRGGTANLLAAIELAEPIGAKSYIFQDAQDALREFGGKMLDLAQAALERKDTTEAIAIANQIPASTSLQPEAQDFVSLADAWRSAWTGTTSGLTDAIATAQKIGADRPLYNKAQELITSWQLEVEDVSHLERARDMAKRGTVGDLSAAITEAELIANTNPRREEAQQEINRWRQQVQTIEDSPYLDRATQQANSGDINSLQAAINEASHIGNGRALYPEARSKIRNWTAKIQRIEDQPYLDRAEQLASSEDVNSLQAGIEQASQIGNGRALYRQAQRRIRNWTAKIQRIEDQPYLDQARSLAGNGNLPAAINAAQQIQPGRALSGEAQAAINDWQGQLRARQNWQEARRVALEGTPDALRDAIRLADRVPTTSPLRTDINAAIAQWSEQMLSIAKSRGEYDIPGGIAIAKQIPRGTNAYNAAQEQIAIWQKFLNPEPPSTPEQPNTSDRPQI